MTARKRDPRRVHLERRGAGGTLVAACGKGAIEPGRLRRKITTVRCVACQRIHAARDGRPWLIFTGTQCSLVWAHTKAGAVTKFRCEWADNRVTAPPRSWEIRAREFRESDVWWLREQIEYASKQSEWRRAIDYVGGGH